MGDSEAKIAAISDVHVLVRGNNSSNVITRTKVPSTLPIIAEDAIIMDDRARLKNFMDTSKPHPSKPNEVTSMDLILTSGEVHENPIFDVHGSGMIGMSHM